MLPLGLARLVKGAPEVILEHCDTADKLAAMREEIARKIKSGILVRDAAHPGCAARRNMPRWGS